MAKKHVLYGLLGLLLLSQLLAMFGVPYTDNSEPRYAEIARIMAERNDWITPWFNLDLPFWGKPPLSFWFQALAIKLFGTHEFVARFPAWLSHLFILFLLYKGTFFYLSSNHKQTVITALWSCVIYASCVLSFGAGGSVLTDPYLNLGTTLALVSLLAVAQGKTRWQWGFFMGLSIGLLAKGPLALVLILLPLVMVLIFGGRSRLRHAVLAMSWGKGSVLCLALSLPWYIAAELKTPGFLHYFIVGEHIQRFLDAGWQGDRYGTAHQQPRGKMLLYWLFSSFPWGILALLSVVSRLWHRKATAVDTSSDDSSRYYLLATAAFCPIFFSFAGNILWAYNLPALAPLALLLAPIITHWSTQKSYRYGLYALPIIVAVAGIAYTVQVTQHPNTVKTEKFLVQYYQQQSDHNAPLPYLGTPPFSARYYAQEQVIGQNFEQLIRRAEDQQLPYVVLPHTNVRVFLDAVQHSYTVIYRNKRYALLKAV